MFTAFLEGMGKDKLGEPRHLSALLNVILLSTFDFIQYINAKSKYRDIREKHQKTGHVNFEVWKTTNLF